MARDVKIVLFKFVLATFLVIMLATFYLTTLARSLADNRRAEAQIAAEKEKEKQADNEQKVVEQIGEVPIEVPIQVDETDEQNFQIPQQAPVVVYQEPEVVQTSEVYEEVTTPVFETPPAAPASEDTSNAQTTPPAPPVVEETPPPVTDSPSPDIGETTEITEE